MTTPQSVEEIVASYRSLLGKLLDETSFGEYVKSFHHAKVEDWLRTTLTTLLAEREAEVNNRWMNQPANEHDAAIRADERAKVREWITKHSTFADPQTPQDESDKRWEIHYAGYREAMNDVIDYLID